MGQADLASDLYWLAASALSLLGVLVLTAYLHLQHTPEQRAVSQDVPRTMFTNTTLNEMRKAQVVEMYLALQAQQINNETDYQEHIDELKVQLANFRTNEKSREEKLEELTLRNKEFKRFRKFAETEKAKLQELTLKNKELQEKVDGWEEAIFGRWRRAGYRRDAEPCAVCKAPWHERRR